MQGFLQSPKGSEPTPLPPVCVSAFITATGGKKEVQLVLIFFISIVFLISKPLTVKHYIKSRWASVITPSLQACCHHVEIINNYWIQRMRRRKKKNSACFYKIFQNQISHMGTTVFCRQRKYVFRVNIKSYQEQFKITFPETVTPTSALYSFYLYNVLNLKKPACSSPW